MTSADRKIEAGLSLDSAESFQKLVFREPTPASTIWMQDKLKGEILYSVREVSLTQNLWIYSYRILNILDVSSYMVWLHCHVTFCTLFYLELWFNGTWKQNVIGYTYHYYRYGSWFCKSKTFPMLLRHALRHAYHYRRPKRYLSMDGSSFQSGPYLSSSVMITTSVVSWWLMLKRKVYLESCLQNHTIISRLKPPGSWGIPLTVRFPRFQLHQGAI